MPLSHANVTIYPARRPSALNPPAFPAFPTFPALLDEIDCIFSRQSCALRY